MLLPSRAGRLTRRDIIGLERPLERRSDHLEKIQTATQSMALIIYSLKAFVGKSCFDKERVLFEDRFDPGICKATPISITEAVHEVGNPTKRFGNRSLTTE